MDRTVPTRGNDEIALYIRTYYSLLRTTTEVKIKTLIEAHMRIGSALHVAASEQQPDMAAFIYCVLRTPDCLVTHATKVVLGQSATAFAKHGYGDIEAWQRVGQPARRRPAFFDGDKTLAVYITSRSDIDDLVPILTAYQLERSKMYRVLNQPRCIALLRSKQGEVLSDTDLTDLAVASQVPADDFERLRRIWGLNTASFLLKIATVKLDLTVRLLGGTYIDYTRATSHWWAGVEKVMKDVLFDERPVYFVSSNTHSLANLLSGFALQHKQVLVDYIKACGDPHLQQEYADIVEQNVPSSRENFLYYTLKKYEAVTEGVLEAREKMERNAGISRIPSQASYDVEVQIVELNKLDLSKIDPRLQIPGIEKLSKSNAIIVNIDFPLGVAAYHVLTQIARHVTDMLGVYIMGKAATLNGRIGDVMIPRVVHDEQSNNTYLFNNCFRADHVFPYLIYGSVLDNQKALTARGTFLQNEEYMAVFYKEGYTIMEMEAGPYLSSVYETVRPQRYPINELVNLHGSPFPVGILHYASDTPFSKGKNLGASNLSYFGMDPTYATMIAILRAILGDEAKRLG